MEFHGTSYDDVEARVEEDLLESPTQRGIPSVFAPDPAKQHLLLYPIPSDPLSAKLRYQRIPNNIDTLAAGDGAIPTIGVFDKVAEDAENEGRVF